MELLRLGSRPEVWLICLGGAMSFGWYYLIVAMLPSSFSDLYGFSAGTIGTLYIPGGIGNGCGAIMAGLISDWLYRRQTKRNGGISVAENRLTPLYFALPFVGAGTLLYGWCLYYRAPFFISLIGFFLCMC